jgi:hypothetical protein
MGVDTGFVVAAAQILHGGAWPAITTYAVGSPREG